MPLIQEMTFKIITIYAINPRNDIQKSYHICPRNDIQKSLPYMPLIQEMTFKNRYHICH